MRKHLLSVLLALLCGTAFGQLTGIKAIPGDYASIQAAITALNTSGVGSGGVTFNVAAGHSETFTLATAGTITATGTVSNPIVFQKSGAGNNPKITAASGTGARDGIIKLSGTDYITFDGIDLLEAVANNNTQKQMEWGYALVKKNSSAPIDGCSHVVIKNCSISLTQTYTSTKGIYVANHTATSTSLLTLSTLSDVHSECSFHNNTISNCNIPISIVGYNAPSPYTLFDQNMKVGVEGGNTISNFAGGKGIYTKYQYNVQIANNAITETVGSNTALYGIHVDAANQAPAKIQGNAISLKNGLSLATAIYGISCGSGSITSSNTCAVTISGNIVQNCSYGFNGSTGFYGINMESTPDSVYFLNNQILNNTMLGNGFFYGMFTNNPTVAIITGNTVSGNTKACSSGYFYCVKGGNSTVLFDDNNITNNALNLTSGVGTSYITAYHNDGAQNQEVISNNTINGISLTGTTIGTMSVDGIYATGYVPRSIFNNNISNLSVNNGNICGINIPGASILSIHHNQVYGISNLAGASTNVDAKGILANTFNSLELYNNIISDINAPQANSPHALAGLYIGNNPTFGQIASVFYNTIYLDASSSGALFGTSAFYCAYAGISNYLSLTTQNNIFIDKSTPNDWGKAVAFRRGGVNMLSFNELSDNNNLYAGTPGPNNLIYDDGLLSFQTLAEYKQWMMPREQHSITENTPFLNASVKPYNLHVDAAVPTQCESAALEITTPFEVATDIDNDVRFPNPGYPDLSSSPATKPDIGADEFAGIHLDVMPPTISYTSLQFTGYTGNRTLIATITDDYSGVPVSGIGLPMLYWKINLNGAWSSVQSTFASTDNYSFIFGDGAVNGDTVYYYIVAQDLAEIPNVAASPPYNASGFSSGPPACSVPPDPDQYRIASMCGTYYVGAGQDFENLTAAINKLDQSELTCPVVLLLTDSINASLTHTIYPFYGSSATNTVTIKPAPNKNVVLTAFSFAGVFDIVGATNFIIDGSNLPNGNTHNLYINNLDGTGAPVIKFSSLETAYSKHVTIKNCNLIGGGSDYSSYGISCIGVIADSFNILNNRFWNLVVGIELYGDPGNPIEGCTIANNTFGSMIDTLRLSRNAINAKFTKGLQIQNNLITNLAWAESAPIAVDIDFGNTQTQLIGNNITGIKYTGTFEYGAIGIRVRTQTMNSDILIANNILSDISGTGNSAPEYYGITGINIAYTHGIKVLHNSINLYGDIYGNLANQYSAAIFLGLSTENLTLVNNILRNTLNDVNQTTTKAYAFYSQADSWMQTQVDYNCYYTSGPQGVMVFADGVEYMDLITLNAATGTDSYSIITDPMFSNPLTLVPALGSPVLGVGTPLVEVPVDFLGVARSLSNPSLGAYEYGGGTTNKTLVITARLEGLYEGTGLMRKATLGTLPIYLGLIADAVTVELHDATNYNVLYLSSIAYITTAGTISLSLPSDYNQQYYITLRHRSHLNITTATPLSFEFDLIDCQMTTPANVFANNLKQSADGYWLLYAGDTNQDGFVDATDLNACDVACGTFATGYAADDVDCNGVVDAADLILIDNNTALSAQSSHP